MECVTRVSYNDSHPFCVHACMRVYACVCASVHLWAFVLGVNFPSELFVFHSDSTLAVHKIVGGSLILTVHLDYLDLDGN